MTLRKRLLALLRGIAIALSSTVGVWFLRSLGATLRFGGAGVAFLRNRTSPPSATIFAFWHDQLLLFLLYGHHRFPGCAAMISRHQDADAIARAAERLGVTPIRGSSTRGGLEALGQLARHLREGRSAVFTPDGPRGPRHVAGEGAIVLAQRAGARIVPVSAAIRPRIRVGSWDRLQIPVPFTRGVVLEGAPLDVPADAGDEQRGALRAELEKRLNDLTAEVETLAGVREEG